MMFYTFFQKTISGYYILEDLDITMGETGHGDIPNNHYNMYEETIETENKGVDKILTTELARLEGKKNVIDKIFITKERENAQMKSATLKKHAENRMIIVIVMVTLLLVFVVYIRTHFPFIPDFILDLTIIVILAGGLIMIMRMYLDIVSRDKLDFEKVNMNSLLNITTYGDSKDNNDNGMNAVECIGDNCCQTGYFFFDNKCSRCQNGQMLMNGKCEESAEAFEIRKKKQSKQIKPYFHTVSYSSVY